MARQESRPPEDLVRLRLTVKRIEALLHREVLGLNGRDVANAGLVRDVAKGLESPLSFLRASF